MTEETKREKIQKQMKHMFSDDEEKFKEKKAREEQLKREEQARKRQIIVKTVFDLTEKYEDYDIKVNSRIGIACLRKPLEVKYLGQFRRDCKYVGLIGEIENRSIDDFYRSNML